jgi:hypothetical protein
VEEPDREVSSHSLDLHHVSALSRATDLVPRRFDLERGARDERFLFIPLVRRFDGWKLLGELRHGREKELNRAVSSSPPSSPDNPP